VLHSENVDVPAFQRSSLTRPAMDTPSMYDKSRIMHAMLADIFGMHEARENDCVFQIELQSDVVNAVHEEVDDENARKFYNLLKEAKKTPS
jgi:transcription initiation factor IIF auxiliary subunit